MKVKSRILALTFALFLLLGVTAPQPAHAVNVYYNVHYATTYPCTVKIFQTSYTQVAIQAWSGTCGYFRITSYGYGGNTIVNATYSYSKGMPIGTTLYSNNPQGHCYTEFMVVPANLGVSAGWRLYNYNNYFVRLW